MGDEENQPRPEADDATHFFYSRSRHYLGVSGRFAACRPPAAPVARTWHPATAVRSDGPPLERARLFSQVAEWIVSARRMKLHRSKSASENARSILPKMARRYFEAGRKAIEGKRPPGELHAFRLKTKRFRYTLELFSPLYGP